MSGVKDNAKVIVMEKAPIKEEDSERVEEIKESVEPTKKISTGVEVVSRTREENNEFAEQMNKSKKHTPLEKDDDDDDGGDKKRVLELKQRLADPKQKLEEAYLACEERERIIADLQTKLRQHKNRTLELRNTIMDLERNENIEFAEQQHDEQQREVVCIGSISSSRPPPLSSSSSSSSSSPPCDKLPPLLCSQKYPWFIVQNLEEEGIDTEFLSTLHDPPLVRYKSEIPELYGRRVRGCFHGWLILSNHPHNDIWSLWNPMSLKIISLPPLKLKYGDGKSIYECLLTAPPDDPTSVLLLTRHDASTFVYCLLNHKRKRMKWTEVSYVKQLKRLTFEGKLIHCLTCCNGRIFALNYQGCLSSVVLQVEIVVKEEEEEVMIQLMLFGDCPEYSSSDSTDWVEVIKGYGTELLFISVGYLEGTKKIGEVCLFRLDTNSINWEELEVIQQFDDDADWSEKITQEMWEQVTDLKDVVFYLDFGCENYNRAVVSSELGGYIHIRPEEEEILYSYHVEDRTIVPYAMPSRVVSTTYVLMWEGRQEDDCVEEVNCIATFTQERVEYNVSHLHNIPFDVLNQIMECCVGVEYLNFRATCKLCHLAAPSIEWSSESSLRRLRNYTLNTPWLMVVYEYREIVTFTDPLSGDNYHMKKNWPGSFEDDGMLCSRFGWLLFKCNETGQPLFFNPFTSDYRDLPIFTDFTSIKSLCFSAPPDSSDLIVAGFSSSQGMGLMYHLGGEPSWRYLNLGDHEYEYSLTFIGRDLYTLRKNGRLVVFGNLGDEETRRIVIAKVPRWSSCKDSQYFLMSCDQHILIVVVSEEVGEVKVLKLNNGGDKWKKISSIGKKSIYVGGVTSFCIDAKTPEMENKIIFPQLVWYSMETRTYHTFDGKIVKRCCGGFLGMKTHFNCHAWIEPSWS